MNSVLRATMIQANNHTTAIIEIFSLDREKVNLDRGIVTFSGTWNKNSALGSECVGHMSSQRHFIAD